MSNRDSNTKRESGLWVLPKRTSDVASALLCAVLTVVEDDDDDDDRMLTPDTKRERSTK